MLVDNSIQCLSSMYNYIELSINVVCFAAIEQTESVGRKICKVLSSIFSLASSVVFSADRRVCFDAPPHGDYLFILRIQKGRQ